MGQVAWPGSHSQDVEEAGFEPRLVAPATCSDCPHCTQHALSRPQTVAECVLYYYLTKKNENYKSLVRRSYRRRGKSQVRGRAGPWALGWFPACSTAGSLHSVPLSGGWDTLWGPLAVPSSREQSWEKWPFLSPENSRTQRGDPSSPWLTGYILRARAGFPG